LILDVQNMKCGGCTAAAEAAVAKLPGVESATFDLDHARGTISGAVDAQAVIDALTAAGYPASVHTED
jgi:Cu+-exporting ATPase